jgi:hypothetical protein
LTTDKLEGLSDRYHVIYARRDGKSFDLVPAPAAADGGNDCAFGAARNVWLKSGLAYALNDVFDLLLRGAVRHVHDHDDDLSLSHQKQKPRFYRGLSGIFKLSLLS